VSSRPSKKKKLKKRSSKSGSYTLDLDHAEGVDETDLSDFCAEIEDSLERDEGVSTRVVSVPIPCLSKRLGTPPSIAIVGASEPSHVGTSAPACTLGRSFSLGGISNEDFGTATRGEKIDLTLFPLAPGPYQMPYPYEGVSSPLYTKEEWDMPHAPKSNISCKDILKDSDVCRKALDRTITPAELRRTKSLLLLKLSNRVNVLSALLVSHGYEVNSRYTNLVSSKARLQEKLDQKKGDVRDAASKEVKKLESQLTDAKTASIGLVRRLLSSDEFHAILARVTSLGINYGVERVLRMGRTDADFEMAVPKVSNFQVGAKADFDKALVDFPTTLFPFLSKVATAVGGTLSDVAQILPNKFVRLATLVSAVPSGVNEAPD
nr:hypothetical protein [Tanacetum cinerariifolium]